MANEIDTHCSNPVREPLAALAKASNVNGNTHLKLARFCDDRLILHNTASKPILVRVEN